jgi:hypothetical protein
MNIALTAAASAAIALSRVARPTSAQATEIEVYRTDHERTDCRVVETTTINRWGDEVTIRQRVCG